MSSFEQSAEDLQAELAGLRSARAKGVTKLRNSQGEEITYVSMAEMTVRISEIERQLATRSGASVRQSYPSFSRGTR